MPSLAGRSQAGPPGGEKRDYYNLEITLVNSSI
jgi:hypothetical protein